MERIFLILPIIFGLILPPYATIALNVKTIPPKNNPLIEKACVSTNYKDLCIQTLKSQPGSENADVKKLAFMSLNVTKEYGLNVSNWVAQKLEDPELGPVIEQALTDCSEQYTDAMTQLEDSMVAFFSSTLNDVKTWMSTALNNANTCEDGLKKAKVEDVMGKKNQVFSQYCSITLAIVNELAKQNV